MGSPPVRRHVYIRARPLRFICILVTGSWIASIWIASIRAERRLLPESAYATQEDCARPASLTQKAIRLLTPSLGDFFFLAVLVLLFVASAGGWEQLLADADTGWHIRTGEWILRTHTVPHTDLFSFSKPAAPWFAWEWLADVIFAAAYASHGLKGVVLISGLLICGSILIVFRYMLWRGAGIALALLLSMFVANASQIHYLARPHLFTLVLLPLCIWLLDRDRKRSDRTIWLLVPIAALWTNLHAGFLALFACLLLWTAGAFVREWFATSHRQAIAGLRRHLLLTCACLLATLANPYGWRLHAHAIQYMKSDWIARNVDEFQPPQIRSEGMYEFEAVLLLGVGLIVPIIRRGRYEDAFLVGFWGHEALQAARHIPLFMVVAAPVVGTELALLMDRYSARRSATSWIGATRQLSQEFSVHARRGSIWIPVLAAILWFTPAGQRWPVDFPARFPSALIARNTAILAPPAGPSPRLLSADDWGGYLIFRFYPAIRVFMDGRSDFYGPEIGNDYICLMHGCGRWPQILDRWRFDAALLPADWPLAEFLKSRVGWRIADRDKAAILFQKLH
jgi:hypothetical protein